MSYQSWSVIVGEQPTTAKWNILGTNDQGFYDGTGYGTRTIPATAYADSSVASRTLAATEGIVYSTSDQGIFGGAFNDVPGLNTGAISVSANGHLLIEAAFTVGGGSGSQSNPTSVILESVNGGSFNSINGTTPPTSPATFTMLTNANIGQFSRKILRSVTAGNTYTYKAQIGNPTINYGTCYQCDGTYLYYHVIS